MVTFADVQASNKKISTLPAGLVGVFSGATAGIGEGTLKAFAKYAQEPVIFLLGRNESAASRIQNEVAHLNPGAKFHFIKVQLSLIQAIDDACNQVKALTKKVDFLCMSQGALSIDGRVETAEGLDANNVCRYYGRMRLIDQLSGPLRASSSSHVALVLAGGMEGKLNTADIELKQPGAYTLISAGNQNTTLVSLGCRRMAREFPATNFVHIYPGTVATEILAGISKNPVLVFVIRNFLMPVLKLFAYTAEECGERVLFDAFGGKYPAHGAYLVGGNCEEVNGQVGLLEGYEGDGVGEKVWRHTLDMWEGAVARGL